MKLYAIQDKTTGYYIPEPSSVKEKNFTHVNCDGNGAPRLFMSGEKAKRSLVEWLKGLAIAGDCEWDDEGYKYYVGTNIVQPSYSERRIKENMHVVLVTLTSEVIVHDKNW